MDVQITVVDTAKADEEFLSLLTSIEGLPELSGKVVRRPRRVLRGGVGAFSDTLLVALGGGTATLTMLARALDTWLRGRTSDVEIEIETELGRTRVSVQRSSDPLTVIEKALARDPGEAG